MWAVCIYAIRRGGWAEKLATTSIVVNSYVCALVISPDSSKYRQVEIPMLMADIALLLVLVLIALRSSKFWPLWLVAFQGITIMAHFTPRLHVLPGIYYNAVSLWSYPMLIVLAAAVRQHARTKSGDGMIAKHRGGM